MFIFWVLICYGLGAIPWSVWLGKWFFHIDPRSRHDRNPGTANAFRAAGWRLGVAVLVLDFCKAFVPVAVARWLVGVPDQQLFWIALMPTLGHAFSVFLGFRGGRGVVVMFGVWAGLTLYYAPLVMGLTAVGALFILRRDEYRSLAIPSVLIVYLFITQRPGWMIVLASAQLAVLAAKIAVFIAQDHRHGQIGAMR